MTEPSSPPSICGRGGTATGTPVPASPAPWTRPCRPAGFLLVTGLPELRPLCEEYLAQAAALEKELLSLLG
ncbi:hypothetical protein [Streptomyces sp. NPDC001348]